MQNAADYRKLLAAWYHAQRRTLPWREDPQPYKVWLSEIMLQQTQVATVIPYFERFLQVFPTVHTLAQAEEEEVLTQWSGLGYYRRARFLHKAARVVSREMGGHFPSSASDLEKLPGIGAYTSRAIASIAFGEPVAVLDGNVARVLSRWIRLTDTIDSASGSKKLWALAQEVLDARDPSSHNQAMMELGALICAPTSPRCPNCPVANLCQAHLHGDAESYPKKKPKKKARALREVAAFASRDDNAFLMARRPNTGLLAGMWELPGGDLQIKIKPETSLAKALKKRVGLEGDVGISRGHIQHVFSHRRLDLEIFEFHSATSPTLLEFYQDCRWVHPSELSKLPLSSLTRKVLKNLEIVHE
jgi:A/G-specific adenine glycosylase